METFFIFYGLIESSNSVYVYKWKGGFNLWVTFFWGICFIFVGLVGILNLSQLWIDLSYILFGLSWFPMMFTPCNVKIFRINRFSMFVRRIVFLIIGISQFVHLFNLGNF
jgi:hypothetical protein